MTEKEKMIKGLEYNGNDEELVALRNKANQLTYILNNTKAEEKEKRINIINRLFEKAGSNCIILPNFKCDYGFNIKVGDNFFCNYNVVILDTAKIEIGNNCLIAPQVGIYTATHSINRKDRVNGMESSKPIKIGDDCWIGGNSVILPGVILGNNVIVGAGSVVTKSFGDNVIIAGNPAKILRKI